LSALDTSNLIINPIAGPRRGLREGVSDHADRKKGWTKNKFYFPEISLSYCCFLRVALFAYDLFLVHGYNREYVSGVAYLYEVLGQITTIVLPGWCFFIARKRK